ncbi:SHOCT domain-containing protein [Pseudonocardia sichuanensis]|uniref:Putative oligomerization/nucleic acid binding protein n=1 Tax=Pseudonocardia kunmingensis TaxID=630975 RepID=A0A543DWD5_9PSEU|nr:SHOCT domain-containing protein [Pseudonocardia kunmingensis]TQM13625.1 putative oligomerization/nucleic acid binding protein [Pseudonocardia kunmingensis]
MFPLRRLGRPGLLGTVARTAVVAGTAQMTSNAVNRHAQRRAMEEAAAAQVNAPPPPPPPPAQAAPPAGDDLVARLESLARLRDSGALSEEEFQAAKGRLLQG